MCGRLQERSLRRFLERRQYGAAAALVHAAVHVAGAALHGSRQLT